MPPIKTLSLAIFIFLFNVTCFAQVGINKDNPNPSAILDIHSYNRGVLLPSIELSVENIFKESGMDYPNGLLYYNTHGAYKDTNRFFYFNNENWHVVNPFTCTYNSDSILVDRSIVLTNGMSLKLDSGSIDIKKGSIKINGSITLDGKMDVSGNINITGDILQNGAYVRNGALTNNGNVLVNGNLIADSLFGIGSGVTMVDAAKLNGKTPPWYASKQYVDSIENRLKVLESYFKTHKANISVILKDVPMNNIYYDTSYCEFPIMQSLVYMQCRYVAVIKADGGSSLPEAEVIINNLPEPSGNEKVDFNYNIKVYYVKPSVPISFIKQGNFSSCASSYDGSKDCSFLEELNSTVAYIDGETLNPSNFSPLKAKIYPPTTYSNSVNYIQISTSKLYIKK